MSNKKYTVDDYTKQQLWDLWFEQNDRRIEAENTIRILEKDSEHWRAEANKFQGFWNEARKPDRQRYQKEVLEKINDEK